MKEKLQAHTKVARKALKCWKFYWNVVYLKYREPKGGLI